MNRKEFLKICGILGVGLPFQLACHKELINIGDFKGKIIIIGAGAGGLSAGYLLQQLGVDFEILEASDSYGGRMRINTSFADFPIPLGAEWLETKTSIFKEIVNDSKVDVNIETYPDKPEYKFINSSWFNFFEDYILPSIAEKIRFNTPIHTINYEVDKIVVESLNGLHQADKVILSVPLKVLQNETILFTPKLPFEKESILQNIPVWDGFKAFLEFSDKFYEDEYAFDILPETDGQKIYYNAALGQKSTKNILGVFTVGKPASYLSSLSEMELKAAILMDLNNLYGSKATSSFVKLISQNWQKEPFIKGGYLSDYADWRMVKKLSEPVENKLFFSGSEFTDGEDWVSVHTAAIAAQRVMKELFG